MFYPEEINRLIIVISILLILAIFAFGYLLGFRNGTKVNKDNIIRLLRDCVSQTWLSKTYTEVQDNFDEFLYKHRLINKDKFIRKEKIHEK
jgi:hypothetical protein